MEVRRPQYWQSPDTLDQIFTSAPRAVAAQVTQATQVAAEDVLLAKAPFRRKPAWLRPWRAPPAPRPHRSPPPTLQRNQATNALANTGHGATSTGAAVSTASEKMVPLSAIAHYQASNTPLAVNHQGLFVASTISFNLKPGAALSDASTAIEEAMARTFHVLLGDPRRVRRHPRRSFRWSFCCPTSRS